MGKKRSEKLVFIIHENGGGHVAHVVLSNSNSNSKCMLHAIIQWNNTFTGGTVWHCGLCGSHHTLPIAVSGRKRRAVSREDISFRPDRQTDICSYYFILI